MTRKPKTMTFTNDFHNTEATVRAQAGDILTPSQVKRVRNKLCGTSECKCGETELRTRGRQLVEIEPMSDGRVQLLAW